MELTKEAAYSVLQKVPAVLRQLQSEKEKLASKLAEYERREMAETIVAEMEGRGMTDPATPFLDKVATLLDSGKDLQLVKEAMSLSTPDFSFASVADHSVSVETLEDYLVS